MSTERRTLLRAARALAVLRAEALAELQAEFAKIKAEAGATVEKVQLDALEFSAKLKEIESRMPYRGVMLSGVADDDGGEP